MSSSYPVSGILNPFNRMEEDADETKQEDDKKVVWKNTTVSLHGVAVSFQGGIVKKFIGRAFTFLNQKTNL